MSHPVPHFAGVGAARAGTTMLWTWLDQHPDVHVSRIKETNYFTHDLISRAGPGDAASLPEINRCNVDQAGVMHASLVTDREAYEKLLARTGVRCCGEVSPSYLFHAHEVAKRIRHANPACKIIVLLREPVDRAFSQHALFAGLGREPCDMTEALSREDDRIKAGWEYAWAYRQLGLYHDAVASFIRTFGRENVLIRLYDDLVEQPHELHAQMCRFLSLSDRPCPSTRRVNASASGLASMGLPRTPVTRKLARIMPDWMHDAIRSTDQHVGDAIRALAGSAAKRRLKRFYADDVTRLDCLLPELDIARRWRYPK